MTQPAQRPFRSKQNYGTPKNFIAATKARLRIAEFAHDFAADAENAQAATYFDEARDALSVPKWADYCRDGWGWLNPPFTEIGPWARKCRETRDDGGAIAFLVPAAVGSNWFRDYVDGHAYVLLLNGRLAFMPDKPTWLYPKDCILALYDQYTAPGYEVWDWRKSIQGYPRHEPRVCRGRKVPADVDRCEGEARTMFLHGTPVAR